MSAGLWDPPVSSGWKFRLGLAIAVVVVLSVAVCVPALRNRSRCRNLADQLKTVINELQQRPDLPVVDQVDRAERLGTSFQKLIVVLPGDRGVVHEQLDRVNATLYAREWPLAGRPIPAHGAELQLMATRVKKGYRGCDGGDINFILADGTEQSLSCDMDTLAVFGKRIHADDLLALIEARADANRTGEGPMDGDRHELLRMLLLVLTEASHAQAVDAIIPLLVDPDDDVRIESRKTLESIGKSNPNVQARIAAALHVSIDTPAEEPKKQDPLPQWVIDQLKTQSE